MKNLFPLVILVILLSSNHLSGQDTVFVQKHSFSSPVRNVFDVNGSIHVKTGEGVYFLERGNWRALSRRFDSRYVFFDSDFYPTDYIPTKYTFNAAPIRDLIPQRELTSATLARSGNALFISLGGKLYEYVINTYYKRSYNESSIRDIYIDDSIKVVSSYSGIFINDSLKSDQPSYSSGHLSKINNQYLLCTDDLYRMDADLQFKEIKMRGEDDSGYFRRLLVFNGELYGQFNTSISKYDSLSGWEILHNNHDYRDIDYYKDYLLFSTKEGLLFSYKNGQTQKILDLQAILNDIYIYQDKVYLGTNDGLFVYYPEENKSEKLLSIRNITGLRFDPNNNLWISTENGLFLCEDGQSAPLPFIQEVEFNRGAMIIFYDQLYIGSTSGVYEVEFNQAIREFIPKVNSTSSGNKHFLNKYYQFVLPLSTILIILSVVYFRKNQNKRVSFNKVNDLIPDLDFNALSVLIKEQQVLSVEALAEALKTNTVQLNRKFKNYNTTPGKFLKEVKIQWAQELADKQTPMSEIVKRVGYSAVFLKKHLRNR